MAGLASSTCSCDLSLRSREVSSPRGCNEEAAIQRRMQEESMRRCCSVECQREVLAAAWQALVPDAFRPAANDGGCEAHLG